MIPPRRRLLRAATLLGVGVWLPADADEAAWQLLAAGGWALLLRHAQTVPGIGDPAGFRLDDCATQRNLSDAGRTDARRLGEEFVRRSIRIDEVLSSRWCRCLETARLAFPGRQVQVFEALNSFFDDDNRREPQTAQVRGYLSLRAPGWRVVMVTHQVNITALTGDTVSMGEALVLRLGGDNPGAVLGRLRAT
jgi:broad specificity phosphatase PhoE